MPCFGLHLFKNTKPLNAVMEQCSVVLIVLRNKFNAWVRLQIHEGVFLTWVKGSFCTGSWHQVKLKGKAISVTGSEGP
jgi:hypothetical protein